LASERRRRRESSVDRRSIGMDRGPVGKCTGQFPRGLAASAFLILLAASARAQGPQIDVGAPPGAAGGASTLGQPLGAADFPDFETPSIAPFSGRAGSGGSRAPASALAAPGAPVFRTS